MGSDESEASRKLALYKRTRCLCSAAVGQLFIDLMCDEEPVASSSIKEVFSILFR